MTTEIRVPALGESVSEATVAKWMKAVGDAIAVDEPIVELETDKVTVEVPSPVAGTLEAIVAEQGSDVAVGAVLGSIAESGSAGAGAPKPAAPAPAAAPARPSPVRPWRAGRDRRFPLPSARPRVRAPSRPR